MKSLHLRIVLALGLGMTLTTGFFAFIGRAAPGNPVLNPPRNSHTAAPTTTVSITYDEPISATTVTSHTFAVHAMQSGLVTATHGVVNNTIIVTPAQLFHQGELVYVIATTRTLSISGTEPLFTTQWQFNAGQVIPRCVAGFTDIDAGLPGVMYSSAVWGDYDSDGDLDILLTGWTLHTTLLTVYRNDGGSFANINTGLTGIGHSSVRWGDYDNDGDLDILVTGEQRYQGSVSKIYRNDDGIFADIVAGLAGVSFGSVAWGDYDNDGDLDILITGSDTTNSRISKIYRNDDGIFTDIGAALAGVNWSSVAWGDYDNDGDLDILLTGIADDPWNPGYQIKVSKVYRNNNHSFGDIYANLIGVDHSSVAWGDYDNDGDLDILLAGIALSGLPWPADPTVKVSRVYRNNDGNFSDIGAGLMGVSNGEVAWGDYDNDGDLDILLAGYSDDDEDYVSKVYRNDSGMFTDLDIGLTGVSDSAVWGDYDNDGDLDILLTGQAGYPNVFTKVYRNDDCLPDLEIVKTITPQVAAPGSAITYTLAFSNNGTLTATNIAITDDMPISVTVSGVISSNMGITDTGTSQPYVWNVTDLHPGESGVITITGVLSHPLPAGTFTNIAIIVCAETESDNGNNSDSAEGTLSNVAPVANARPDQSINTNTLVTLDGSGSSDANGDALTYGWTQTDGLPVALSNHTAVSPTIIAPDDPTTLIFTLVVTDSLGLASTPDTVVITITNQPPSANAGPNQCANTSTLVTLDGNGSSDPDNDLPLTCAWTQTGGIAITLSNSSAMTPTFTTPTTSTIITFTLTTTDALGLGSAPDIVVVTVSEHHVYLPLVLRIDELTE